MTVAELIELLSDVRDECYGRATVIVDGCDCLGLCAGVEISGEKGKAFAILRRPAGMGSGYEPDPGGTLGDGG